MLLHIIKDKNKQKNQPKRRVCHLKSECPVFMGVNDTLCYFVSLYSHKNI